MPIKLRPNSNGRWIERWLLGAMAAVVLLLVGGWVRGVEGHITTCDRRLTRIETIVESIAASEGVPVPPREGGP